MKRLFLAFLLVMGLAIPAQAGWNVRQNDDGSTVWVDQDSIAVPVGDTGITVRLTDVSTASTEFVVSHKSGKIKKVYATTNGNFTSSPVLTISIGSGSSATFTPVSQHCCGGGTLTMEASPVGGVTSITLSDSAIDIEQGEVISVSSDGGSTGQSPASVVIIIE
jgi:hypothetical protein